MRLEGKVVLVTASTRGIGYAIVERCAKEGAIVYMAARNMELANEKASALIEKGYKVKPVFNDAYDYESYKTMVDEVVKNEGHIDVLVNNFGTSNPKKDRAISNTEFEDYIGTVNVNLASVFISSQAVIPHMAANGGGSIINISSIGGLVPDISQVAYGTSKAATITSISEGIITVTYKLSGSVVENPTAAGNYEIYVSITKADNYNAVSEYKLDTELIISKYQVTEENTNISPKTIDNI